MSFEPGDTIGDYEVIGLLGAGGMGRVYKVRHVISDRVEALKVLLPDLTNEPDLADRFMREIKVQASLNHPNIASMHTALRFRNQLVLVMELIEGATVGARLRSGFIPHTEAARYARQALAALDYAHGRGVVHRDVKPANMMVLPDGVLKLMDFGIARGPQDHKLTQTGMALGSLLYMAPEQIRGEAPDPRSDVYSLGVTLYEMLTAARPFQGDTSYDVMNAHMLRVPLPPHQVNPAVPVSLSQVVMKSLSKSAADRYQSAAQLSDALGSAAGVAMAFTAAFNATTAPVHAPAPPVRERRAHAGHRKEKAELAAAFARAESGQGGMICLAAEPGLGKTSLADDFLAQIAADGKVYALARGRGSERLDAEPYLALRNAIQYLLAGEGGAEFERLLASAAPLWRAEPEGPASQDRFIRDVVAFFEQLARILPAVLFIDDLHWVDKSSLEALCELAACAGSMRLLILGAYRESDLASKASPFAAVRLRLQRSGLLRSIDLDLLDESGCAEYLDRQFPNHHFPADFAALLRDKTGGNPLFLVETVRWLRDRRLVIEDHGRWTLTRPASELAAEAPDSVRGMVQAKLDELVDEDRRLLLAASAQGRDFDSAILAKALQLEPVDVEDRLDALDKAHGLIHPAGELELPDGTITMRYRFAQAPYYDALSGSLKPARRAQLSTALANALRSSYGDQIGKASAQLAVLLEAARDFSGAVEQYAAASTRAAQIGASHEAVALGLRGVDLLGKLPDNPERAARELALRLALGGPMTLARYASPDVRENYARARELCIDLGENSQLVPVMWGLWLAHLAEARLAEAGDLATQMLSLANDRGDAALRVVAHWAAGATLSHNGQLTAARDHLEAGIRLYNAKQHESFAAHFSFDPGVACRVELGGRVLWLLGYADRARDVIEEALGLARKLSHPPSLVFAQTFAALLYQLRREPVPCQERAGLVLADEAAPKNMRAIALLCRGWAQAASGSLSAGIEEMGAAVALHESIGSPMGRPHFLALLAEAMGRAGNVTDALAGTTEALRMIESTGQRYYQPELLRLRGDLLRKQGISADAEACYRQAITAAREQGAAALELRAAVSLARLKRSADSRAELERICGALPEQSQTLDWIEARAALG